LVGYNKEKDLDVRAYNYVDVVCIMCDLPPLDAKNPDKIS
jgi:hypothetical protein